VSVVAAAGAVTADKAGGNHWQKAAETMAPERLHDTQLERLRATLRNAVDNVPFYRRRLDEAGIAPNDLTSRDGVAALPFTTKADLRDHYPFGMFAVPRERLVRVHASSGTTGNPTTVGYTRGDVELWADLIARTLAAGGLKPGDMLQNAYGYGLFTGGLGYHYGAERLGCTVIPMSGGQSERQVQLIMDFKPDIICATPSYMLALAEEFSRQGIDPADSGLRVGLFGAEPWTNEMRREIESLFCIDAIDTYGLSEVIGPGVAFECIESKDGPHIFEDHFYPEIIDPATGEVLAEGEFGELVFTSLTKEALPVIRYRTRDLTRLLPGTARPMRRMDKITGRSDDMLIIRGVNVFPSQIEELILKNKDLSPHYVLEVSRDKHLDKLDILVEMKPGAATHAASTAAELQHHVKSYIGISSEVRVLPAGTIERSVGKAKRVIDMRG
jgi:phenylacetate-CoA ligase